MATGAAPYRQEPELESFQHKRAKPSVLRSLLVPNRAPSDGINLPLPSPHLFLPSPLSSPRISATPTYGKEMNFFPGDHARHAGALTERQNIQSPQPQSPTKSFWGKDTPRSPVIGDDKPFKSLHKKTLSSLSLRALAGKADPEKGTPNEEKIKKPKKNKSSTNLASLLSRPKSSKSLRKLAIEDEAKAKNKENQDPPLRTDPTSRPPIYAQFSSELFTKQPLGGKFLEDEISLYSAKDCSPAIHQSCYSAHASQQSLLHRGQRERPKSTYLPSSFSIQDINRKDSNGSSRRSAEFIREMSGAKSPPLVKRHTDVARGPSWERKPEKEWRPVDQPRPEAPTMNRRSRVLAAVTAFGGSKPKSPEISSEPERKLDDEDVKAEFEAMLDRRNIPQNQRGKMYGLGITIKKDFIRQDWAETAAAVAAKNDRPGTNGSDSSADVAKEDPELVMKKSRPRSRTFTFSRKSSKESKETTPVKEKKQGTFHGKHSRQKSTDSVGSGKETFTFAGATVAQNLIAKAKGQTPDDFVSFLQKNQRPESVEVGRLHKLRLLLRNETVAWTDGFIGQGGMEEIVGLLRRTMEVEWREEHEDALLHEVLLCLKALCTTALALQHLNTIQKDLFPALLHMLFDEEKKGPSEFTTRNIVSSLLFTYLKSAPLSERWRRAKTLLSYLRDPEPSEDERPVEFVLEMRRSRPFQVWNKEVVNVTKEVFWIFLHGMNVIALPGTKGAKEYEIVQKEGEASTISSGTSNGSFEPTNPHHLYMAKHFPQELPPVPAAPYVGGVEWDATNYLASHLDIVNGILACLPTRDDRNTLREQLRISGWEKCMGGTLRTCKEKFYGGVHAGLRCWVAAASEDGWDSRDVRCGPATDPRSPVRKSPQKSVIDPAPRIDIKLSFTDNKSTGDDMWL